MLHIVGDVHFVHPLCGFLIVVLTPPLCNCNLRPKIGLYVFIFIEAIKNLKSFDI